MRDMLRSALLLSALTTVALAAPIEAQHEHRSDYAGMEAREIKTFSAEDLAELRAGHGWGLSLVAELNGVPGPKHVLEMRDALDLSPDQVEKITTVYEEMRAAAISLGEELIRLERDLDAGFAAGMIDEAELRRRLEEAARVRGELRFVHLSAHLATPRLLTAEQVEAYSRLRGYDGGDPCRSVPPGHDPKMWRRHNDCND